MFCCTKHYGPETLAKLFLIGDVRCRMIIYVLRFSTLPSGVLQIVDVVRSDVGQYRCKAVNIAKERHSSETELQVTASE